MVSNANRVVAKALIGLFLAGILLLQVGCSDRQTVTEPGCDLTIVVDKEFLKHLTPYQAWPDVDFLFEQNQGGIVESRGDPRALVFFLVIAVPVVVVAEVTGLTYHNLRGVQVSFTVSGDDESSSAPVSTQLHWGENRVVIPKSALAPLMAGTASLHIDAFGTREVHLRIPVGGMDWTRAAHAITLVADGRVLVDGQGVEIEKVLAPEPGLKLGPLRGKL